MSAKTLGVLAVLALVVAFSLSSTLVKRAKTAGVLVAFWRLAVVSLAWNAWLWCTGRRVTLRDVRAVWIPGDQADARGRAGCGWRYWAGCAWSRPCACPLRLQPGAYGAAKIRRKEKQQT